MNVSQCSQERFHAAYDTFSDMLFRIALSHLQNQEDARDAVQDVFVKFLSTQPTVSDEEHEKAWLIRVTLNQCRDMLRRRKLRSHLPLDEIKTLVAEPVQEDSELLFDVMQGINSLSGKNKTAAVLFYLEGMSVEEVAKVTGSGVSAVKMRLARSRKILQDLNQRE